MALNALTAAPAAPPVVTAAGNDILVGDARYGAFHRFIEPDELRFSGIQIADLRLTQLVYRTTMLLRQLNYYRSHRQRPVTLRLSRARDAFRDELSIAGDGPFLFPSDLNPTGHQVELKTVWQKTLRRAKVPYFRIYDLRSTYATRLSAGGVAAEWVTQLLRQGTLRSSNVIRK